jgi:hypothetical protein
MLCSLQEEGPDEKTCVEGGSAKIGGNPNKGESREEYIISLRMSVSLLQVV